MTEPRSYQQTLTLVYMVRAGGRVTQDELEDMGVGYVTNIITALLQRGLVRAVEPRVWELTDEGESITNRLLSGLSIPEAPSSQPAAGFDTGVDQSSVDR